jgi:hypothetical protein
VRDDLPRCNLDRRVRALGPCLRLETVRVSGVPFAYPVRSVSTSIHEGGILVPIFLQQTDRRADFAPFPLRHPSPFFCDFSCFSAGIAGHGPCVQDLLLLACNGAGLAEMQLGDFGR